MFEGSAENGVGFNLVFIDYLGLGIRYGGFSGSLSTWNSGVPWAMIVWLILHAGNYLFQFLFFP